MIGRILLALRVLWLSYGALCMLGIILVGLAAIL